MKLPSNPFVIWVKGRIKKNRNAIILVNGSTGSGKSYASISLAQEIAKELGTSFNVNDNLSFKFTDLLQKMNLEQNQGAGVCFVFEEVGSIGSGAASRQWQSKTNLFFNSFVQTSRHRNQILIMNCPSYSALEKSVRALIHTQLETLYINPKEKVCYLKPYICQTNSRTGKTYFKYLRVKYDGKQFKFNKLGLKHPGDKAVDEYEKMKMTFTTELNQMIIDSDKGESKLKPLSPEQKEWKVLWDQGKNVKEIAEIRGYSERNSSKHKQRIENKGYCLEK